MSKFVKTVAAAAVLSSLASTPSRAATLQTDVDVTLPSVIALYCYDEVDVNVTAAGFVSAVGGTNGSKQTTGGFSATPTAAAGEWNVAVTGLDTDSAAGVIDTDVNLNMTGVCAFRAISGTGVTVSIATQNATLAGTTAGNSITVGTAVARDNATGGAYAASYPVAASSLGWGTVRNIDIQLPLDLANAGAEGTYSSATDGTFEVEVIATP